MHRLGVTGRETDPWYSAVVLTVGCILPLSNFRAFSKVRFVSMVSFASILYVVFIILVTSAKTSTHSSSQSFNTSIESWEIFSIVLYAYTCQPDVGLIAKVIEI